jgi:5'-3' exonuclease
VTDRAVVLAVDGNSLVHRSFHALASTGMRSASGEPIWAVRGLLTQLVAAVDRIQPSAVIVGFDDPDTSVRRTRWPQYKANRTEKLETLVSQLKLAGQILRDLGIAVVVPPGLEADDVLASAAGRARSEGADTVIMTSDRDSFAMIDHDTSVLRIINGGVDSSPLLTPERLVTLLGIGPHQYQDYAALRGDPSDNLPGVRGIGPKTAAKLLARLGSARAAFDDLALGGEQVRAAIGTSAAEKLADPAARAAWELNCTVMSFHENVDLELGGGTGCLPLDEGAVRDTFTTHQLPSTLPLALRALAHCEVDEVTPTYASAGNYRSADVTGWNDGRGGWRPRRFPRLTTRPTPDRGEQLSLFG